MFACRDDGLFEETSMQKNFAAGVSIAQFNFTFLSRCACTRDCEFSGNDMENCSSVTTTKVATSMLHCFVSKRPAIVTLMQREKFHSAWMAITAATFEPDPLCSRVVMLLIGSIRRECG
jgi:hypothetical protein